MTLAGWIPSASAAKLSPWLTRFAQLHGRMPIALTETYEPEAARQHLSEIRDALAKGQLDAAYALLIHGTPEVAARTGIWTLPAAELPVLTYHFKELGTRSATALIIDAIETEVVQRTQNPRANVLDTMLHAGLHWVLWPRLNLKLGRSEMFLDVMPAEAAPEIAELKRAAIVLYLEQYVEAARWTESAHAEPPPMPAISEDLEPLRAIVEFAPESPARTALAGLIKALSRPSGSEGCQGNLLGEDPDKKKKH